MTAATAARALSAALTPAPAGIERGICADRGAPAAEAARGAGAAALGVGAATCGAPPAAGAA